MNKEDAKDYFENVHHDHHQAVQMRSLFHSAGWEAIPVTWICIDWEKHFRVRGDDQDFDVTSDAFWKQSRLIHCCEWCGHANLHMNWVKDPTCEACDWTEEKESKHDKSRREYVKRPTIEFHDDQDINLGEEWL